MLTETFLNGESASTDAIIPRRPDRAAINRANAQHSTGPRTSEGKRRSAMNAMRHGLTSQVIVMPDEDMQAYQCRCQEFFDEYAPQTPTEKQLVQEIADTAWRLNRIPALEINLFSHGIAESSAGVSADHPQAQAALDMARVFAEQSRAFLALSTLGQRLARQFEKAVKQLRELQAERRTHETKQLDDAADLMLLHEAVAETPYDPTEDGFVFSTAQIDTFLERRQRRHQFNCGSWERPIESAA
jgi:hypothetical protein